jgi:hypothetical protein
MSCHTSHVIAHTISYATHHVTYILSQHIRYHVITEYNLHYVSCITSYVMLCHILYHLIYYITVHVIGDIISYQVTLHHAMYHILYMIHVTLYHHNHVICDITPSYSYQPPSLFTHCPTRAQWIQNRLLGQRKRSFR